LAGSSWEFQNQCAIAGIGATEFSRDSGRTELSLAIEAARGAIADAGLSSADIDGIVCSNVDRVEPYSLASALGTSSLAYAAHAGPGGVAPPALVGLAVGAVLSGQAECVLAFRSLNGRSGRRFGAPLQHGNRAPVGGDNTFYEYFMPYGILTPTHTFALLAQRHMAEFGTTSEQLGQIALTCRERANDNPRAQMHGRPLRMPEYLNGRMIADPLRLNDCCLETDGACAFVVTRADRARGGAGGAVLIRAVAQATRSDIIGGPRYAPLFGADITTTPAAAAAALLYARAGLQPRHIDTAQLYDCFTISVLLQLEDYGFCAKGEGGPFAASGALGLTGSLPINTGGGHLSEGYLHGMNHILEGVRQLRGDSTSPLPSPEHCLVTATPIPATSAVILSRDPR
jgi:acetyl-CoA acetyltransferase